ncbi:hypothetical protein COX73_02750 [bacterium (Candidatus Gribaldobacteria) CG_4_10_14_0_2_um_filter_36_18]|uniref:Uncharacterized protein n=1 Tax=bacterium (Candidatus Gribaldobacteria) CG_4_10_14_0_2_um_filter_36_18 TaxID=2014264 RepID=A0A2M7VJT6_9BACT|nr:MAG: hypothetical protein COX73_02750 [bacterium (Candidatus Gribaldobacteria) CG_4_10_14_0_2_um_filter_36_18]
MNTEKIIKIVNQIQAGLDEIKREFGSSEDFVAEAKKNKPKLSGKKKSKGIDLTQPIKKLYEDKFFSDSKTDLDVKDKLELDLLTEKSPKRSSIVNVLRKMVKDGLLTRDKILKGKRTIIGYKNKA